MTPLMFCAPADPTSATSAAAPTQRNLFMSISSPNELPTDRSDRSRRDWREVAVSILPANRPVKSIPPAGGVCRTGPDSYHASAEGHGRVRDAETSGVHRRIISAPGMFNRGGTGAQLRRSPAAGADSGGKTSQHHLHPDRRPAV